MREKNSNLRKKDGRALAVRSEEIRSNEDLRENYVKIALKLHQNYVKSTGNAVESALAAQHYECVEAETGNFDVSS